jgi:hypothetical protein
MLLSFKQLQTASQTHLEVLPMLFQPLQHFIDFYLTAFVFKLQNYLEKQKETSPPSFIMVITLQMCSPSTL